MKLLLLALLALAPTPVARPAPYTVDGAWPVYPSAVSSGDGSGIAVSRRGEVYALHRGNRVWNSDELSTEPIDVPVVMVFDARSGMLLRQWGEGHFAMPHGISVDARDNVWITDVALHQVSKFSRDGRLLLQLGQRGISGNDARHFNRPTDVLVLRDGSFLVADGYRNTRIVKFSADGRYLFEWGMPGDGPGALNVPHSLALGQGGELFVCDRNNGRIQIFTLDGRFKRQFTIPGLGRPFAIAQLDRDHLAVAGNGRSSPGQAETAGIVVIDRKGQPLERFGSFGEAPGQFIGAHDIAAWNRTLFVAGVKGRHFQKFVRLGR